MTVYESFDMASLFASLAERSDSGASAQRV
jgi:hypothetical protein